MPPKFGSRQFPPILARVTSPGRDEPLQEPTASHRPFDLVRHVSAKSPYASAAQRTASSCSRILIGPTCGSRLDISKNTERAEADSVCFTPMLLKRVAATTYVLGDFSNVTALVDLLRSCGMELAR